MATTPATVEITPVAFAAELAVVWGGKLSGKTELKPTTAGSDAGWLIVVPVEGAAKGQIAVWFEAKAAAAAAKAALKLNADPKDDQLSAFLGEVVTKSAETFVGKTGHAASTLGAPAAGPAPAPKGASAFELVTAGKNCKVTAQVELTGAENAVEAAAAPAGPSSSRRLEAVLDVDLPLVVRFGRATMPLRALAVLGPGSVIDMGRSPDEPVELLVGDRLIARGEVVVVGGNYGVRITDMTGSQPVVSELEARTA
jgi:flagellar motor switch protein FliN